MLQGSSPHAVRAARMLAAGKMEQVASEWKSDDG